MLVKRYVAIILFLTLIGLVVWQNHQLRSEKKSAKEYVANGAHMASKYLLSVGTTFESINKENQWDDLRMRSSQRMWLAYTYQSLIDANKAWQFYEFVPGSSKQNINDVFFSFLDWYGEAMDILEKEGAISKENKGFLLELSHITSKVDLPEKSNDFNGMSDLFEHLSMEWKSIDND